ncbi:hypothetical protein ZIOFF_031572 [Zingiber officinale]|uniref:Uncharacterized protein n=1 Tax=Zingiber officinale TaxID=94328 RepID=A0A8J5GME2_ZINOF|nr:hypothetical protein ZIOFF_031572 [Zingiber officinale]
MVGVGLDACCHCAHAGARMKDQFSSSDVFFKDLKSLKKVIEDMSIQVNVPALAMEEVAPLAVSDAAMLAPEEIFHGKGNIKEEAELTKEERKRRRANQKRRFRRLKGDAPIQLGQEPGPCSPAIEALTGTTRHLGGLFWVVRSTTGNIDCWETVSTGKTLGWLAGVSLAYTDSSLQCYVFPNDGWCRMMVVFRESCPLNLHVLYIVRPLLALQQKH